MKIAIIGGHVSPAIAVIRRLQKDEVFYIGRKHAFEGDKALSFEYQEITSLNIPFFPISTARLQRKFTRYTVFSLLKFPAGLLQSFKILKKINPDVVVGFGGYVSVPVVLSAYLLKIPIVIHEQTLEAGAANKMLSPFVKKILISWESSRKFFPKDKTILTGNPIRQEIVDAKKTKDQNNGLPLIYITGGSGGSHFINSLVGACLDELSKKFTIVHQAGASETFKDYDNLIKLKEKLDLPIRKNYEVKKFFSSKEAALMLNKADLVVSRAGINTVSELMFLNKPAFLIPLPFSQRGEQLKNAEFLKKSGLGDFIEQKLLSKEVFLKKISEMILRLDQYNLSEKVQFDSAVDKIIKEVRSVQNEKGS